VEVDPAAAGMDPDRLERITDHFGRYVEQGTIPGCQVTVARGGGVAYFRSMGTMDRERGTPVAEDTVWRIYSMTKPITSVALMQRYELGEFLLTDPVHRFLPEWRDLRVEVAGDDGSTHPVDHRYNQSLQANASGMTLEGAVTLLADLPLKFHPGTRFNYGLSTDICGRLVEVLSGQPFDEYLDDHVFGPLGMVDTGFSVPGPAAGRLAACYLYAPGSEPTLLDDPTTSSYLRRRSYLSGAGGLVSTSGDYLRFCQMLLGEGQLDGERIIGRKTLELMTANHLPGGRDLAAFTTGGFGESGFEGVGFGLGFAVGLGPAATATVGSYGEYYWGGAASTAFWVDPVEDVAVVFMTQLVPSTLYPFRSQLRALVYQALVD
jgi:CubicO group peptidase (beta-lactamase class C family)